MRYHIIASGSKGNATVIYTKNTRILIDMGLTKERLVEGLKEIGLTLDDLDAYFFTHDHSDHIKGIKFLKNNRMYSLEGTLPVSDSNIMELWTPVIIKDFIVTAVKTSHDATNPCGFMIETKAKKLVYITDTGYLPQETKKICADPDYLILESNHDVKMLMSSSRPIDLKNRILGDHGHLCNEDSAMCAIEMIGKKTKEIVLAHLSEECNTPEVALEAYRKIFRFYGYDFASYNIRCANQHYSLSGGSDGD